MLKFNIYSIFKVLGILILLIGLYKLETIGYYSFITHPKNESLKEGGVIIFISLNCLGIIILYGLLGLQFPKQIKQFENWLLYIHEYCKKDREIKLRK